MDSQAQQNCDRHFLPGDGLEQLFDRLTDADYTIIGPTMVDGVIMFRPIDSVDDLPKGKRDTQTPGTYRLVDGDDDLWFDYVVGPEGPKKYFFPPSTPLFSFSVANGRFEWDAGSPEPPKLALVGVRPCELAAIAVQDRVFGHDDPRTFRCESEPWYTKMRERTFIVAVNCTRPGGNCFCDSMKTGPAAREGFDIALTEIRGGFIIETGTSAGAEIASSLPIREPTVAELELVDLKLERAREHMGRRLDVDGVKGLLDENLDHPEWQAVAQRCLSCGNCTMVCPTCFCSTVTDATGLADGAVTRTREWESCFTHAFSYTTSGPDRNTIAGRYRHWLRHKLCTWWDQFGMSGCIGCGRCITWCPVGIDLTEEIARLRGSQAGRMLTAPVPHNEVQQ